MAHVHPPHYAHFGPPRVAHFDPPKVVYYARFLHLDAFQEAENMEFAIKNGYNIWGIDQEFHDAPIFLMDEIYFKTKVPGEKGFYEKYRNAKNKWSELIRDTTSNKMLNIINDKTINDFFKAASERSMEAKEIVEAIKHSNEIYNGYFKRYSYFNKNGRALLMREYFHKYYNEHKTAGTLPKAVIKLGSMHTTYGRNPSWIYDVGNTIYELAIQNNSKSFNIKIGGRTSINSKGERIDRLQYTPEMEALYRHQVPDKFTLIDLRAIKEAIFNRKLKITLEKDRDFFYLLRSHDAVLLTELHSATLETKDFSKAGK